MTESQAKILDLLKRNEPLKYSEITAETPFTDAEVSKALASLSDRKKVTTTLDWRYTTM